MHRNLQTDLAHQNPFTVALKNFGNNFCENVKGIFLFIIGIICVSFIIHFYLSQSNTVKCAGIDIRVFRDGKSLSPSQLERDYQDWLLQMHMKYDEEVDRGEDQPILVVSPSPAKGKTRHISSDGRHEQINIMIFPT